MQAKIHIRPASHDDIPLIQAMAAEVFPHTYKDILTVEQIDYMMDWMYSAANLERQLAEGHSYFIAETDSSRPCGYVSVQQEYDAFHLQKIYVLPEYQGLGIGKLLFGTAMDYVVSREGPRVLRLNVNRYNKAIRFYEKMGMRKVAEGDFPIGGGFFMNDYIMQIEL